MTFAKFFRIRRPRRPPVLTKEQSTARVRELRRQGFKVQRVRLSDGTVVVLRSRRPTR